MDLFRKTPVSDRRRGKGRKEKGDFRIKNKP